ncbi:MAG: TetR/AcrR family transcriptional regulator [Pusillimonas sp.]
MVKEPLRSADTPKSGFESQESAEFVSRRPRVAPEVETAVLDYSFMYPSHGQDRVARELCSDKIRISASGVRYVWQRHNLENIEKRVAWIEKRVGSDCTSWGEDQALARSRVLNTRVTRSIGASMVGKEVGNFSRSMHILTVAARLLRERSFEAISLRDIAVKSHVPLGSIYYHFPTKEELFAAVYEEGSHRLMADMRQALAKSEDPWGRLELGCKAHLNNLCGGDDFMAVSMPTRLPELSVSVRKRVQMLNAGYEDVFRKLVDDLPLVEGVSRSVLRLQILGALNWTSIWYKPDLVSPEGLAIQLVRCFRSGCDASR